MPANKEQCVEAHGEGRMSLPQELTEHYGSKPGTQMLWSKS
jgi:hypothetical protein